jgi:hypothetical protein
MFWRNPQNIESFLADGMRVDRSMEAALAKGSEVLFATELSGPQLESVHAAIASMDAGVKYVKTMNSGEFDTNINEELIRKISTNNMESTQANNIKSKEITHALPFRSLPMDAFAEQSRNIYIAVPTYLEGRLLQMLDIQPFSENVKVSAGTAMQVEGRIKRKIRPTI